MGDNRHIPAGGRWALASVFFQTAPYFLIPPLAAALGFLGYSGLWFLCASLCYFLFLSLRPGGGITFPTAAEWRGIVPVMLLQVAGTVLFFMALQLSPPGLVALLSNATALFTVLGGVLFLGERLSLVQLAGGGLVIGGAVLLTWTTPGGELGGLWLTLGACAIFAVHSLLVRRVTQRVAPLQLAAWRTLGLTVAFLAAGAVAGGLRWPTEPRLWLFLALGGLAGPFLNILCYYNALRRWEAGKVELVRAGLPLVILLAELAFFGSSPTLLQLLGGLATLPGVILLLRAPAGELTDRE